MDLGQKKKEIKRLGKLTVEELFAEANKLSASKSVDVHRLGMVLNAVKKKVGHGHFRKELKKFPFGISTANNYMKVSEKFKEEDVVFFDSRSLYLMAKDSFPSKGRKHIIAKAREGKMWTEESIKSKWEKMESKKNNTEANMAMTKGAKSSTKTKKVGGGPAKVTKFISGLREVRDSLKHVIKKSNRPKSMPPMHKTKAKRLVDEIGNIVKKISL